MTTCPYCGTEGAYDTGVHVECVNPKCRHYMPGLQPQPSVRYETAQRPISANYVSLDPVGHPPTERRLRDGDVQTVRCKRCEDGDTRCRGCGDPRGPLTAAHFCRRCSGASPPEPIPEAKQARAREALEAKMKELAAEKPPRPATLGEIRDKLLALAGERAEVAFCGTVDDCLLDVFKRLGAGSDAGTGPCVTLRLGEWNQLAADVRGLLWALARARSGPR